MPAIREVARASSAARARGPVHRALRPLARPHARLLDLQSTAGNAAVAALIQRAAACTRCSSTESWLPVQRGLWDDVTGVVAAGARAVGGALSSAASYVGEKAGDALDVRENEAELDRYEDARSAREAWVRQGVRGPKNLRAPTGLGGFGAKYDPASQTLIIRLGGGVTFTDGIRLAGGQAIAVQPKAGAFATQINALPADQREAAAAPFKWTDGDKSQFLTRFRDRVQTAWSGQHQFRVNKEFWDDLGASVRVEVQVHEGAKTDDEHMSMTAYKVPDNFVGGVGVVNSGAGGATSNTMLLNSNDVAARRDNLLRWDAAFPRRGNRLDATNTGTVTSVGGTFRGAGNTCQSCGRAIPDAGGPVLTITVQGDGRRPEASAEARFRDVKQKLTQGGFQDVDRRTVFVYGGVGQAVNFQADNGVAQVVAEHEAGHMFGLGDEYAVQQGSMISGTGGAAGTATKHDKLAKDMGLEGAVNENNDNMMSLGTVVRPQHYSTFFWALKEVTAMQEWVLGAPRPVARPASTKGPGDFPAPRRDTAVA